MHTFQSPHPVHTPENKLSNIDQHVTATKGWSGTKKSHLLYNEPGPQGAGTGISVTASG